MSVPIPAPGDYPTLTERGVVTHVLVPIADFERLTAQRSAEPSRASPPSHAEVDAALAVLANPHTKWHGADEIFLEIVRAGIEHVRRTCGVSQTELAKGVGLSQSQISRIESNPENASLGVLRRIAAALADRADPPSKPD